MAGKTTFAADLKRLGACKEAVKWVGKRSAVRAWRDCRRGDWMAWYIGRVAGEPGSPGRVRLAACLQDIVADPAVAASYAFIAAGASSVADVAADVAVDAADAVAYAAHVIASAVSADAAVATSAASTNRREYAALARFADIVRKHYPTIPATPEEEPCSQKTGAASAKRHGSSRTRSGVFGRSGCGKPGTG